MTPTAGVYDAWELMARLKVQALAHRLSDLGRKRLRVVRPRQRVEVDEHVVACAQIAPRLNVGNLEELPSSLGARHCNAPQCRSTA
eukprot:357877-Prymnesium_polylepis.2